MVEAKPDYLDLEIKSDIKILKIITNLAYKNNVDLIFSFHDFEDTPKRWNWDEIGTDRHWGVVFIDHRPGERRKVDILRLKSHADIIVVHDTQQSAYQYEEALASFKYRYTYERYATQTTVVSDVIDVADLFNK